jgi:hypothetical protein
MRNITYYASQEDTKKAIEVSMKKGIEKTWSVKNMKKCINRNRGKRRIKSCHKKKAKD